MGISWNPSQEMPLALLEFFLLLLTIGMSSLVYLLQLLSIFSHRTTKPLFSETHHFLELNQLGFSCLFKPFCLQLPLLFQEIGRLTLDANRTADGVLAVERGIMSLRREARDVEGELQRKLLEIDMDTTSAQEVS